MEEGLFQSLLVLFAPFLEYYFNYSRSITSLSCISMDCSYISTDQVQGTFQKWRWKESKSLLMESRVMKCWLLNMTWLLHTSAHSICAYLNNICTKSDKTKKRPRRNKEGDPLSLISIQWAIENGWLLCVRNLLPFGDMGIDGLLIF